jgi:molybdopterin-guanine dinucleotide biosynthesis protein A
MKTQNQSQPPAAHSPISGPFRAEANTVKAISHGSWFTVVRCDNPKFTPEAKAEMAAHVAHCLNANATIKALREALQTIAEHGKYSYHSTTPAEFTALIETARAALNLAQS